MKFYLVHLLNYAEFSLLLHFIFGILLFLIVYMFMFPNVSGHVSAFTQFAVFIVGFVGFLKVLHDTAQGTEAKIFPGLQRYRGTLLSNRPCFGQSAVVTGANTGIGFETCVNLSKLGYRMIMVCRNEEKGEKAKEKIILNDFEAECEVVIGDLSDVDHIKHKLVPDIIQAARGTYLSLLINNAGIAQGDGKKEYVRVRKSNANVPQNDNGNNGNNDNDNDNNNQNDCYQLDKVLVTNFIGPFLLTELLIPVMSSPFGRRKKEQHNSSSSSIQENSSSSASAAASSSYQNNNSRNSSWICSKCSKRKTLEGDHLEGKSEVFSECWPCARKTKFKFISSAAASSENVSQQQVQISRKITPEFTTEQLFKKAHQASLKLENFSPFLSYPRIINVSSIFHLLGNSDNNSTNSDDSNTSSRSRITTLLNNNRNPNSSCYSLSKLCNIMHSSIISFKSQATTKNYYNNDFEIVSLSCAPGLVNTSIWDTVLSSSTSSSSKFFKKFQF